MLIPGFNIEFLLVLIVILTGALLSVRTRKLTRGASITGAFIGILLYTAAGILPLLLMAVFFILAVLVTRLNAPAKQSYGVQPQITERRAASQVLANAGVPAIAAAGILIFPQYHEWLELVIAGAFAASTGDTVSSEFGNAYGRKFFDLRTLRRGSRGENGVLSLEGTLSGVLASALIALLYAFGENQALYFIPVIAAGIAGNLMDSLLGAFPERSGKLSNDMVNILSNGIGGISGVLVFEIL